MKGKTRPEFTFSTHLEIEPANESIPAFEVPVTVELTDYIPYTRATHIQPEEGGGYETARVWLEGAVRVEIEEGATYESLVEQAHIEAHIDDAADYGDYLYERMRDAKLDGSR